MKTSKKHMPSNEVFMLFSDLFMQLMVVVFFLILPVPQGERIDPASSGADQAPLASLYLTVTGDGELLPWRQIEPVLDLEAVRLRAHEAAADKVVLVTSAELPIGVYQQVAATLTVLDLPVTQLTEIEQ